MSFANNCIKLPITNTGACRDNFGTLVNRHPVEQAATVVGRAIAFPTLFFAAKMLMKITSLVFILENKLVNPLMADCNLALTKKPSADLFGTPVISQETLDQDPCVWRDSSRDGLCPSYFGKTLGLFRAVSPKTTVAASFSTNCRFVNTDNFGDLGLANSCFHKGVNLVSLFLGELRVVSHQCSSYFRRLEKHEPTAARLSCQLRRVALQT